MIVLINRELYRYEIHSLVKAFYPEEDVKVLVGEGVIVGDSVIVGVWVGGIPTTVKRPELIHS